MASQSAHLNMPTIRKLRDLDYNLDEDDEFGDASADPFAASVSLFDALFLRLQV
jgi:hypothetical protein